MNVLCLQVHIRVVGQFVTNTMLVSKNANRATGLNRPRTQAMVYTAHEMRSMGVELFVSDSPETRLLKTSWQKDLQDMLIEEDVGEGVFSKPPEMLVYPLPWPEDHLEEIKKERLAAMASAQEDWRRVYGDGSGVLDLICDESEVDFRMAMWRHARVDEVEKLVLDLFMLYDAKKYVEVVEMAAWLIPEHQKYEMWVSTQIEQIVRDSEDRVMEEGSICMTCEGGVFDM